MENLEAMWVTLKLMEEEDKEIEITEDEMEDVRRKGELCLIGRVWVDIQIGRGVIETAMNKIWRLSAKTNFREVGLILLLFPLLLMQIDYM